MHSISSVQVSLIIPNTSYLQSTNGQFLTLSSSDLVTMSAPVGPVLVPQLSKTDAQISKGLFSAQNDLQNENSVAIQILQQSFLLKYLINSQLIAALMLIDQLVPLNYYLGQ